jgi:hypothetical protein
MASDAVKKVMGEEVIVPAKLFLDLIWAAESLSGIEFDDEDAWMIGFAKKLLMAQAPKTTALMLEVDFALGGDACNHGGDA